MLVLLTGSAGFIGFHTAKKLLEKRNDVIGLDNFNNYYNPAIKESRNKLLEKFDNYKLYRGNLEDLKLLEKIFSENKIGKVCHLAAQAGIRYSLINPFAYVQANLVGFVNLIETAKNAGVKDFIFASSSSVYGDSKKTPFSEEDRVDTPISLYAATKKLNEEMAYAYHHLFGLNCTGLRFFTCYGPFGRPDMALFKFTNNITKGREIEVFNYGEMMRDFTYIDDIVSGIMAALEKPFNFEIFNLGRGEPIKLTDFIEEIEKNLGIKAKKKMMPMQPGDVHKTFADISKAKRLLGYEPKVSIQEGIKNFIDWYKDYYKIK